MSNCLLLDAKAREEEETERERGDGPKQKRSRGFSKANSVLIFVLTNQVSLFEARIRDHFLSYLISLFCPPAVSIPF